MRDLIRKAPLYQQMPVNRLLDPIWQMFATLLYSGKLYLRDHRLIQSRLILTRNLESTKEGIPLLVIGNGPSANDLTLEQVNLLRLKSCEFAVMNEFHRNIYLSSMLSPNYYFLSDPGFYEKNFENRKRDLSDFLQANPDCFEVRPANINPKLLFGSRVLYFNPISGAGIFRKFNPLKWRSYPDSVLFAALCFAIFRGYNPIYLIGADNSMYKYHFYSKDMRIQVRRSTGFHSYEEPETVSETLPNITRSMSDVLYAHAVFLHDLKRFCAAKVVNVGITDETNDALPKACLLPRDKRE